jgi:chromosome segregation ATPase
MNTPEKQDEKLEQLKAKLYKINNSDPYYQAAIKIIKYQSRQIGGLKAWNDRYRSQNDVISKGNSTPQSNLEKIKQELNTSKQLLARQVQKTQALLQEREEIIQDLKKFDEKVYNLKVAYEEAEHSSGLSLWQRIQVVMLAVKELLSPTETPVIVSKKTDNDPFSEQPQMKCDRASINRSLLDK